MGSGGSVDAKCSQCGHPHSHHEKAKAPYFVKKFHDIREQCVSCFNDGRDICGRCNCWKCKSRATESMFFATDEKALYSRIYILPRTFRSSANGNCIKCKRKCHRHGSSESQDIDVNTRFFVTLENLTHLNDNTYILKSSNNEKVYLSGKTEERQVEVTEYDSYNTIEDVPVTKYRNETYQHVYYVNEKWYTQRLSRQEYRYDIHNKSYPVTVYYDNPVYHDVRKTELRTRQVPYTVKERQTVTKRVPKKVLRPKTFYECYRFKKPECEYCKCPRCREIEIIQKPLPAGATYFNLKRYHRF